VRKCSQSWPCNPAVARTMVDASDVKKMPELLMKGFEIYEGLKADMANMLGLKQYAEHMTNIVQTMKEVNKHLEGEEKEAYDKLSKSEALALKAMTKASIVISTIKSQAEALVAMLEAPSEDEQKVRDACLVFAAFAQEAKQDVKDAEDMLDTALSSLGDARTTETSIESSLERIQNDIVNKKKAAESSQRAAAYGGAAAGILAGPLGLIVSYSIAAGVCEGLSIPAIEEDFKNQRATIQGYISGFENMKTSADDLTSKLSAKRDQLIDIHGKLSAVGTMAGVVGKGNLPKTIFQTLLGQARNLVQMCD